MSNATELQSQIDDLQAIVDSGVSETTVAGEKVRFDLAHCSQRLMQLKRELARIENPDASKPSPFSTIDLSGAF